MNHLTTERLRMRRLDAESHDDALFLLELLNQRSFIEHIADRQVRSIEDAARYMREGPIDSYRRHGFGLLWLGLRGSGDPIGICGLLKRDYLEHPDIGYALLDRYAGKGYAQEAAQAMLDFAWRDVGANRIAAITSLDNRASIRLLEKLGMRFERVATFPGHDEPSRVFGMDRPPATKPSNAATPGNV